MNKMPRYEKYKNSGVEWLGDVPERWDTRRLGYFFEERREKVSDKDFAPLSVTKNGVIPQMDTAAKTDNGDNRKRVCKGDFVINSRSDRKGSSGLSTLDGSVSLINIVLSTKIPRVDMVYMEYLLKSVPFQEEFYRYGRGIVADLWSTPYAEMKNIVIVFPSADEQHAIATFLNRETSKIDALVEEQERMIELLKERRQAVISRAVTKGLDPNVKMKDSGIEWLGEVPEHWVVTGIKYYCEKITDGAHVSPETENGVYCFVSTKDISDGEIDFEGSLRTSQASFDYLVRTGCKPAVGDVLFSKDGTVGNTAVVRAEMPFVVASSLIIIRPVNHILDPDFLNYLCISSVVVNQVQSFVKGAGLPRLSIQNLLRVNGLFPPIREQRLIAQFLRDETQTLSELVYEAEHAIELLKERRSALISAAVTGKIDVRGLVEVTA